MSLPFSSLKRAARALISSPSGPVSGLHISMLWPLALAGHSPSATGAVVGSVTAPPSVGWGALVAVAPAPAPPQAASSMLITTVNENRKANLRLIISLLQIAKLRLTALWSKGPGASVWFGRSHLLSIEFRRGAAPVVGAAARRVWLTALKTLFQHEVLRVVAKLAAKQVEPTHVVGAVLDAQAHRNRA